MFLDDSVSAVLLVRIQGKEQKNWPPDKAALYVRIEPCCTLKYVFEQGGQGKFQLINSFNVGSLSYTIGKQL